MCDLNMNGYLSRDEFNWFNIRTSGEAVADDEWQVVEGENRTNIDSQIQIIINNNMVGMVAI